MWLKPFLRLDCAFLSCVWGNIRGDDFGLVYACTDFKYNIGVSSFSGSQKELDQFNQFAPL